MNDPYEVYRTLRQVFGHERFRPHQEEIIRQVLARRNTLAVLPSGHGKSLCYQLPAYLFRGAALVFSPLVALMKDQIDLTLSKVLHTRSVFVIVLTTASHLNFVIKTSGGIGWLT